jgi:hypothetical protein
MKDLKRFGTMTLLLLLAVVCTAGTLLAKGKPNQEPPAVFVFPDLLSPSLTGDGLEPDRDVDPSVDFTTYADHPGGVEAYFMGSGNPKLELGDPVRYLVITFEDDAACGVPGETFYANGDALWFSGLAWDLQGLDPIEDRFLGMEPVGATGYSKLILRFITEDESGKDYLWRVVFGDFEGASRVKVEKTAADQWRVYGAAGGFSTAHVTRGVTKGKSDFTDFNLCSASIDFDIKLVTP